MVVRAGMRDAEADRHEVEERRVVRLASEVVADREHELVLACAQVAVGDQRRVGATVGIRHEAAPELGGLVKRFYWAGVARLGRMIRCFKREKVEQIVMAGKIRKTVMHTPWRILSLLPFSFDYGLNQLLTAVQQGATLVLQRSHLPADICRALERHQITGMAAVPTLWIQLMQRHSPSASTTSSAEFAAAVTAARSTEPHSPAGVLSGGSLSSIVQPWVKVAFGDWALTPPVSSSATQG